MLHNSSKHQTPGNKVITVYLLELALKVNHPKPTVQRPKLFKIAIRVVKSVSLRSSAVLISLHQAPLYSKLIRPPHIS